MQDVLALPGEGTGSLAVGVAAEGEDGTGLVMLRLGAVFPGVVDADDVVAHLGDGGRVGEGADVGAEVTGHLVIGMVGDHGVGVVVASGGPVGLTGVGAQVTGPDQGVAGNAVGEAFGDVELRVVGAGSGDGQLRDGGHGEVPGEVLQNDVLGLGHCQGHHVAVHHEEGALTVDGQVLVLLNQQTEGLDGVFDGVGVGGVVFAGFGLVFIDVVFALGENQGDGLALLLQFLGGGQSLLDGHGAVGCAGGISTEVQCAQHCTAGFFSRYGSHRHCGQDHGKNQDPCQEFS